MKTEQGTPANMTVLERTMKALEFVDREIKPMMDHLPFTELEKAFEEHWLKYKDGQYKLAYGTHGFSLYDSPKDRVSVIPIKQEFTEDDDGKPISIKVFRLIMQKSSGGGSDFCSKYLHKATLTLDPLRGTNFEFRAVEQAVVYLDSEPKLYRALRVIDLPSDFPETIYQKFDEWTQQAIDKRVEILRGLRKMKKKIPVAEKTPVPEQTFAEA